MINLDTHIVVFALAGQLKPREKEILSKHQWCISDIVFWELAKLVEKRRLSMDLNSRSIRTALNRIHCLPIDLTIACRSCALDFAGDPADQVIAATSIVHEIPLLTRDKTIRSSKMVPLI